MCLARSQSQPRFLSSPTSFSCRQITYTSHLWIPFLRFVRNRPNERASERARATVGANENSIPVTLKPETNEENVIGRKGRPPRRARESDRGRFRRRCPKDYIQILLRNPLSARLFDQQRSVIYAPLPSSRPPVPAHSIVVVVAIGLATAPSLPSALRRTRTWMFDHNSQSDGFLLRRPPLPDYQAVMRTAPWCSLCTP